jgi:hypothetical protein
MAKSEKLFFNILYFVCFFSGSALVWKYTNSATMFGVLLIALAVRFAIYIEREGD